MSLDHITNDTEQDFASDRPWTYNPANSLDIGTPVGSSDYWKLRDAQRDLLSSHTPALKKGSTGNKLIILLMLIGLAAIWMS